MGYFLLLLLIRVVFLDQGMLSAREKGDFFVEGIRVPNMR